LLVQHLDGGHALALLGSLDAVGQTDDAGAHQHGLKKHEREPHPAGSEFVQIESLAVEQMKEAVVCLAAKVQHADIAGNTGPIAAATESHQGQDHPQKGA
jgi:hypothetical protein